MLFSQTRETLSSALIEKLFSRSDVHQRFSDSCVSTGNIFRLRLEPQNIVHGQMNPTQAAHHDDGDCGNGWEDMGGVITVPVVDGADGVFGGLRVCCDDSLTLTLTVIWCRSTIC